MSNQAGILNPAFKVTGIVALKWEKVMVQSSEVRDVVMEILHHTGPQILWRKLSRITTKLRNLQKFSSSKVLTNQLTQLDKSASCMTVLFHSVLLPSHAFEVRKWQHWNVTDQEIQLTFKHRHNLKQEHIASLAPRLFYVRTSTANDRKLDKGLGMRLALLQIPSLCIVGDINPYPVSPSPCRNITCRQIRAVLTKLGRFSHARPTSTIKSFFLCVEVG